MAVNNNAVSVSASLTNNILSAPAIGASATGSTGFTDADEASDNYKLAAGASAGAATSLHADLGAAGWIMVVNPAGGVDVTLYVGSTTIGVLPPGMACVFPITSGSVIKGGTASTAQAVGVTVIKTTTNA